MRIRVLLCLLFLLTSFGEKHDYYLSTTSLKWVPSKSQVQITSRFFLDDIEALMQDKTNKKFVFLPDSDPTAIDDFVKEFYLNNLSLAIDGAQQEIQYLGREYKDDLMVLYAEINLPSDQLKTINVSATFLIDFLTSQQNIIHLNTPNQKKSFLLNHKKTTLDFTL